MEIYDTANKLAEELRNSQQFKNLKNSKENLMANEENKQMIIDFENLKREVQIMEVQRQSEETSEEKEKKENLLQMYNVLIQNKEIKEYFEYEIAFNQLMVDVNKIIGNSIKDVL